MNQDGEDAIHVPGERRVPQPQSGSSLPSRAGGPLSPQHSCSEGPESPSVSLSVSPAGCLSKSLPGAGYARSRWSIHERRVTHPGLFPRIDLIEEENPAKETGKEQQVRQKENQERVWKARKESVSRKKKMWCRMLLMSVR